MTDAASGSFFRHFFPLNPASGRLNNSKNSTNSHRVYYAINLFHAEILDSKPQVACIKLINGTSQVVPCCTGLWFRSVQIGMVVPARRRFLLCYSFLSRHRFYLPAHLVHIVVYHSLIRAFTLSYLLDKPQGHGQRCLPIPTMGPEGCAS